MVVTTSALRVKTARDLGTQLHIGRRPDPAEFQPAINSPHHAYMLKPKHGFWTSSFLNGSSDWLRWCQDQNYGSLERTPWWSSEPDPAAEVLVVDGWKAFDAIAERYGYPLYPGHSGLDGYIGWDFERMAADGYAGVHLALRAAQDRHWTPVGRPLQNCLNAWDCESTVWLTWCFGEPTMVREAQP